MRATRLTTASLPIPFRVAFAHAAARRGEAENILVQARDADGEAGYGEGCPRLYVTGETPQTAEAFLGRRRDALLALDGLDALRGWLETHRSDIDANPSAACAAELALLDLFARQQAVPLDALMGQKAGPVVVSAVYGLAPGPVFALQRLRFRLNGMTDAKLKLGGPHDLARARRLAKGGRLRLDANNLWSDPDVAIAALRPLLGHAWAVEEPLAARDVAGMRRVADATGLRIVLDESLCTRADLDAVAGDDRFVLNLRVSKQGGLIRTLALIAAARAAGHRIIVGAQVGETSLLARAGLIACAAAGPSLAAAEIGYGLHLLRRDTCEPSLTFRAGGRLAAPAAGFGPSRHLWSLFPD
ncbi:hypothetical protein BZG35_14195 [Brevundimonas sp. LM2]|uniref:enolase C-terminal domain-like protein n=1 Tax=Brevundimonas sp. LM2 TaxID=1938605 RepID=UPI000983CF9C|nr:enolase C-terminal domain-like protein [Brevundimonas sp. LM2]AQR62669.1 hypothetical protein BZG35_14195 [Brevundimonas sp. LM2]